MELLLRYGADLTSIPLLDVLRCWDPKMIRLFLDNGADVLSDDPFAVAFSERIRTALRPFVDYKHAHPDMADRQLERKLDSIEQVAPELVVASNPGCMLHMARGARARGSEVQIVHLVEVLGRAYPPPPRPR